MVAFLPGALSFIPLLSAVLPSFPVIQTNLFSLVMAALLVDAAIVSIWYIAGAILNNNKVKGSAKGELEQFFGTALMLAIITGVVLIFGFVYSASTTSVNLPSGSTPGTIIGQQFMSDICQSTLTNSQYDFIATLTAPICINVIEVNLAGKPGKPSDPTLYADLPLATTGVIYADLAQQVADNLNSAFIVDSYLQFLTGLKPNAALCFEVPDTPSCLFPTPGTSNFLIKVLVTGAPLAGLNLITQSMGTFSTITYVSLVIFVVQLIFILIFLYTWPYLMFFGFVLRATPFTRKVGGLLIAIAIGGILFYPTIVSMEYLASYNTSYTSGFYQNNVAFCNNGQYTYNENFFQLPSIQGIAQDCNSWPTLGLLPTEALDTIIVSLPTYVAFTFIDGFINALGQIFYDIFTANFNFGGWIQDIINGAQQGLSGPYSYQNMFAYLNMFGLPSGGPNTPTSGAEGMLFGILQEYGIIGVSSYFLPILNLLITLSAIRGLSGVLGGDTSMAGLSRLI